MLPMKNKKFNNYYDSKITVEPVLDKTNKMNCAPSEDSDQPVRPHNIFNGSLCCALNE